MLVSVCLALEGDAAIGAFCIAVEQQPDEPLDDIPHVEADEEKLYHLPGVDPFMRDVLCRDARSVAALEEDAAYVHELVAREWNECIGNNQHTTKEYNNVTNAPATPANTSCQSHLLPSSRSSKYSLTADSMYTSITANTTQFVPKGRARAAIQSPNAKWRASSTPTLLRMLLIGFIGYLGLRYTLMISALFASSATYFVISAYSSALPNLLTHSLPPIGLIMEDSVLQPLAAL